MMPHDNVGKQLALQWYLRGYQPTNKRMIMFTDSLAVGGKPILLADIVLETISLLALIMQPAGQISKVATAKGIGKISCQVCDMIPMLLNGLDNRFRF